MPPSVATPNITCYSSYWELMPNTTKTYGPAGSGGSRQADPATSPTYPSRASIRTSNITR